MPLGALIPGPADMVVIAGVALIIFGPRRMPEIGRTLGQLMRELRRTSQDLMSHVNDLGLNNPLDDEPAYRPHRTRPSYHADQEEEWK